MATEPYQDFLFAMNSPVTRERYSTRLRSFFVYIGIEGTTMEERCRRFVAKVKENEGIGNSKWAYACVVKFLQHQKDRYDKKEISGSTVRGYYKAVKLFAEVNDVLLPWSKIKRGLPRGRHYADDRIPTLEEIRKLVEYPGIYQPFTTCIAAGCLTVEGMGRDAFTFKVTDNKGAYYAHHLCHI
jgi:hypothetical protein